MYQQKEKSLGKKALLICDNRYGINWGCRATSLALIHILETSGYEVISLSEELGQRDSTTNFFSWEMLYLMKNRKLRNKITSILEKLFSVVLEVGKSNKPFDVRNLDLKLAANKFKKIAEYDFLAKLVIKYINETDIIVINGEGDAIFTEPPRFKFLFLLLIMQLGKDYKKPIFYVNAIISPCPIKGWHQPTVKVFRDLTKDIALIAVRDTQSLKFAQEIDLQPRRLLFLPDALFAIRSHLMREYLSLDKTIYSSSFVNHPELRLNQAFELKPKQYICLSAASTPPSINKKIWQQWFAHLVQNILNDINLPLIIVQPCGGDKFISDVAEEYNITLIPPSINVYWGSRILANAKVYITGRYHPSIMASFGGTAQIMLESNSHKTYSLQELLEESKNSLVYPIGDKETITQIIKSVKDAIDNEEQERNRRIAIVDKLSQQVLNLGKEITFDLD